MPKYISEEKFKQILDALGLKYEGITKSGEPILNYNNTRFTLPRKEKFGFEEGYKPEVLNKMLEKVSIEKAKQEQRNPKQVYHELKEKIKHIYS